MSGDPVTVAQRLRIFVSSPGDVTAPREVAAQVIEKVAHEYARFVAIEPYLWEYEPMLASGHFQDSIDSPRNFDVVILILESRLGTPLPERTAVREYRGIDGRTPVTGTEWEFEDALAGARDKGTPDLLVYRSRKKAEVDTWDPSSRERVLRQIEALDSFWSRHFADQGTFIGGYAKFRTNEEFAEKLEQDLRRCVQRRVEALRPKEPTNAQRIWPTAPFRGLESYEYEHAPIFFGREEAIGAALLRLVTNAERGRPFLLVMGASGSGKSSLVKAGVLPRLLVPHRVSGSAFLRRAVFRPSDARPHEDLFDALARRLTESDGVSTGLPELLCSSMSVCDVARHLRESSGHPELPFAMVLDRLAIAAAQGGHMLRYESAKLILEIDQLEELYTSEWVQAEQRERFIQLVTALVRSGLVWVIATMRSDFWYRATETPQLVALADGTGRLDLCPAAPSELSQMIRGPAEAAAIRFETHPTTGIPLNDYIAEEAAGEPGALPLLSYLLDQLYRRDVQELGSDTLSYQGYVALGGLKGAIACRADAVLASLPADVQPALRAVLFALVQVRAGDGVSERAVARRAPLEDFPPGTTRRRLVDALLEPSARLLVADSTGGGGATVRLAHEALINEWHAAKEYVAANAEAFRVRRLIEERQARWRKLSGSSSAESTGTLRALWNTARLSFARERGLLADIDLTDARRLLRDYRGELAKDLVAYVERSVEQDRRQHRRSVRGITAVAVVTTLLAVGAIYEAKVAAAQRDSALQAQLRSLTETAAARLQQGDVPTALGVIFEVLRRGTKPQFSAEALGVFQEARAADKQLLAMLGHTARVFSASFSADGRRVVSASADKTARIWDARDGREIMQLIGHTDRLSFASFSPDGTRIITSAIDNTVRIWDASSGAELMRLKGDTHGVATAVFSRDGRLVVTASSDKTARIWDAITGLEVRRLSGHTGRLTAAAFSADGRKVVTASADKTVRIWDAGTGRELQRLVGHTDRVAWAAFSPDDRRVVSASHDKTARVWDVDTARQIALLAGHADSLQYAAFSPDGSAIVTASFDRSVRLWNAATGQETATLSGHGDTVNTAVFSPDGTRILSSSVDKSLRLWDVDTRRGVFLAGLDRLVGATYSPDGRRIVTASYDGSARVWDVATGTPLLVLVGHTDTVEMAGYSPNGRQIATASVDRTARLWDADTGHQLAVLRGHTDRVTNLAYSPDSRRLVTVSHDGTARIWDTATGAEIERLSGQLNMVFNVMYSPDGRRIVTASADKRAHVWDVPSQREIVDLIGHSQGVGDAEFAPDGRHIVTASADTTARVWDAATGRELIRLIGHHDQVGGAGYSPDGRLIVTASADKTARVWDAETGLQLSLLNGHTDPVTSASFSPDGKTILTSSYDGTVRVWDAHIVPLGAQISWSEAAQFEPLSDTELFQLGIAVSTEIRKWPKDSSKCDQAAAPYDPDRRAPGVNVRDIDTDVTLAACASEQGGNGSTARLIYQHARALLALGRAAEARIDLERAVAQGYRAAQIDLARLLSEPTSELADNSRAVTLYEKAWRDGVTIAGFELGRLYEHGLAVAAGAGQSKTSSTNLAWMWYRKAAAAGDPSALARCAEEDERDALTAAASAMRQARMLDAFELYAAAAERARLEDWPAELWRDWRYRRASIARLLARDGEMLAVAERYDEVHRRYAVIHGGRWIQH